MGRVKEALRCNEELACALQEMLSMAEEAHAHVGRIDVAAFNERFAKAVEAGSYSNEGLFSLEVKK